VVALTTATAHADDPSTGSTSLTTSPFGAGPLPSWNDGAAKKSVVEFVEKVTKEGGPDFVPSAERGLRR